MMDLGRLADPIAVEYLPKSVVESTREKGKWIAQAILYVDGQAVLDHLDQVLGPANWSVEYEPLPASHATFLCRLSVQVEPGQWVSKSAVGECSKDDCDQYKAAQTDALKRASAAWGVGKFLHGMKKIWRECEVYKGRDGKMRFKAWGAPAQSAQEAEARSTAPPRSNGQQKPQPSAAGETSADGAGAQPTEEQLSIEKWCGWFQRRGVTPKKLEQFVGKPPADWSSAVLHRFDQVLKRTKAEGVVLGQALEDEFGQPKLF